MRIEFKIKSDLPTLHYNQLMYIFNELVKRKHGYQPASPKTALINIKNNVLIN